MEVCEQEIATDPLVEKLNLVEKENEYLKEKLKRIEEEKMGLELYVVDVVDDHKIKMDAMRLKIRKIRKYTAHQHISWAVQLLQWLQATISDAIGSSQQVNLVSLPQCWRWLISDS